MLVTIVFDNKIHLNLVKLNAQPVKNARVYLLSVLSFIFVYKFFPFIRFDLDSRVTINLFFEFRPQNKQNYTRTLVKETIRACIKIIYQIKN